MMRADGVLLCCVAVVQGVRRLSADLPHKRQLDF